MPGVVLAAAGRLDTRTGGSIYNRRMAEGLRRLGWMVEVVELAGDFPQPSSAALDAAERAYAAIPDGRTVVADGLALSVMPDTIERHARRLRIVALVHLPVAAAADLDRETAARLAALEGRALAAASRVVATGPGALPLLEPYGLDVHAIPVVPPGVDPAPLATGSRDDVLQMACVATLNAGKGHDVLLAALAALGDRVPPWRLTCAGSLTRDPAAAARARALATTSPLAGRVTFAGDLDTHALEAVWDGADLFVLATRLETYGMAVAEALAHGLPVVGTTTGAIPALVGDRAGVLVPPGDVDATATALGRVLGDPAFRARLAAGAREARAQLPDWTHSAGRMAAVLQGE